MADLPILHLLPSLRAALAESSLVFLSAATGAGKSTGMPHLLLHEPWLNERRIVLTQPRRVAAFQVASRLAEALGEQVGETVGCITRYDRRFGNKTRLEVVTEGVLLGRLLNDPELPEVGMVMLDEFHERSLESELCFALLREVGEVLRPDLRLLPMSATLPAGVAAALGAPLVVSEGRTFPLKILHAADDLPSDARSIAAGVARAVKKALAEENGDVLAFLPGMAEIRAAEALLQHENAVILPLHGSLDAAEQRRAIFPLEGGQRKVVLASSVAETSLTIEGVRVVIDSGFRRLPEHTGGLSGLQTVRVSRAEADQRAGRAGRTAPGVVYRLWSERTHATLPSERPPAVKTAELSALRLAAARWGAREMNDLQWLTAPSEGRWQEATAALNALGATDENGALTPRGTAMAELGSHPRLAAAVVAAQRQGPEARATLAAALALLEEQSGPKNHDFSQALREALRQRSPSFVRAWSRWRRMLRAEEGPLGGNLAELLLPGFLDLVAVQRENSDRFLLAMGQEIAVPEALAGEKALLVLEANKPRSAVATVRTALSLSPQLLEGAAETVRVGAWDESASALRWEEQRRFGAIVLSRRNVAPTPDERSLENELVAAAVARLELRLLNMDRAAELRARVVFLRRHLGEDWPDWSDEALSADVSWLLPWLDGKRNAAQLAQVDVHSALLYSLSPQQQQDLPRLAPAALAVPSGRNVALSYADEAGPVLAVKVQEMFGCTVTPTVLNGQVPVTLHLLTPRGAVAQITSDLVSYWKNGYPETRKDLFRRYPKHPWPEDPFGHPPTQKTKRALQNS